MIDLVLLSGKQGSGKTTTAAALKAEAKRLGYEQTLTAKFADPLYILHDYILNKMQDLNGTPRAKKDGRLLQLLGTEWGRQSFGVNVWVDIMKRRLEAEEIRYANCEKVLILIDDCRFENEFDAFPEALRVRLQASEEIRKVRTESWRDDVNHPSEVSLDGYAEKFLFDLVINTDDEASSPVHCATLILAQLQKKSWPGKRVKP